ncbi:hypothetical protein Clacol_009600 [Clathrus columnatus]|uniref:Major facilitator superfamily (MFS) profile domain-containing protein n=1 Tax=Clathrus columnatus TaxID=1419009 RepID=A0AAV5ARF5_9AGAM|nr:hypothetical protein Clacol_009600 [Clathrus columnatus]
MPNDSLVEHHMATSDERSPLLQSFNGNETDNQRTPSSSSSLLNSQPLAGPNVTSNKELKGPLEISTSNRRVIVVITWLGILLGRSLSANLKDTLGASCGYIDFVSLLKIVEFEQYLLATCTFSPLYGHLSDIMGRRGANQTAILFAGIGTLLCGLSPNFPTLIVSRFITGLGGGSVLMVATIVIADMFSARERGLVLGMGHIFTGIGTGFGGPIGGFFNDRYNDDLPLMAPRVIISMSVLIIASIGFLVVELSIASKPILAPFLLKDRTHVLFGLNNLLMYDIGTGSQFVLYYFFPMFFETVLLTSASEAGAHLVPVSIAMASAALFIGLVALPASVDRSALAVAAGFAQIWRNVGQVWSVAIASAIFQSILARELKTRIIGPGSEEIRRSSKIVSYPPEIQLPAREAYGIALKGVFGCTAVAMMLIPEISLNDSHSSRGNPNDQSENIGRSPPQDIER